MVDVLFLHAAPSDLDALGRAFADGVAAPGLGSIASLLEEEELARARRFRRPADVAEHVFARALVRVALSTVERGIAPSAWRFEKTPAGRPFVAAGLPARSFNVTHSHGLVACAVRSSGAVGIDVEPLSRAGEILDLAPTVFSTTERAALDAVSPSERDDLAVSLWTGKEAYVKALGVGLGARLLSITVSPERGRIMDDDACDRGAASVLHFANVVGSHRLAVSVDEPGEPIVVWDAGPLVRTFARPVA